MAYEGGYTSAVDSAQRRKESDVNIEATLANIAAQQWREKKYEDQLLEQNKVLGGKMQGLRDQWSPPPPAQMGPPPMGGAQPPAPQPMMPGQPSVPMQPPGGGIQQPPGMGGGTPALLQALLQGGAPPGGGMPPPPQAGVPASPAPAQAGPAPMPQPAPQQAGPAPAPPPQGFQPIAGGPFAPPGPGGQAGPGGGLQAPPMIPGTNDPILPPKLQTMESAIKVVDKMPYPDHIKAQILDQMAETMDKQNKQVLETYRLNTEAKKAGAMAEKEYRLAHTNPKLDPEIARTIFAAGGDPSKTLAEQSPEVLARARKLAGAEEEKKGKFAPSKYSAGGGGGAAAAGGGATAAAGAEDVDYSKLSPTDPRYNDRKALDQEGRKVQAWQYIVKGVLPYRKGTGGEKDPNVGIMREVSRIARENNMSPEDIVNMPAEWKANAQSLAFQTKKVDAIESVLSSFHNNIETWDRAAKGLPPQLGSGALTAGLGKIDFTGVQGINDIKLKIQQQFNDPKVVAYLTAAMAVRMDYARIMQGPQSIASLSEGMKEDAKGMIPNGLNDKSRDALIKTLEADTEGQLKGSKDQLTKIKERMIKGERGAGTGRSAEGKIGGQALPMPEKKADLVKGKTYQTARGPATWNGEAFEAQ